MKKLSDYDDDFLNSKPKRLSELNQFLDSLGIKERVVRGYQYCYFVLGETSNWSCTMVLAKSFNDLSFKQWYEEYLTLSNQKITMVGNC